MGKQGTYIAESCLEDAVVLEVRGDPPEVLVLGGVLFLKVAYEVALLSLKSKWRKKNIR